MIFVLQDWSHIQPIPAVLLHIIWQHSHLRVLYATIALVTVCCTTFEIFRFSTMASFLSICKTNFRQSQWVTWRNFCMNLDLFIGYSRKIDQSIEAATGLFFVPTHGVQFKFLPCLSHIFHVRHVHGAQFVKYKSVRVLSQFWGDLQSWNSISLGYE